MVVGHNPVSKSGYLAGVLLFLLAWFVTLGGLIASQVYCDDEITADCDIAYRLPWFIWALCFVPATIALCTAFMPKFLRASSATLFAVVAVLCILMAERFHVSRHANDGLVSEGYHRAITATLVGFSLLAAFALLMLLLDALLSPKKDHHDHHEGGVVHEPKYTHTHTTTVPATHATNV